MNFDYPEPTAYAVPVFVAAMIVERRLIRRATANSAYSATGANASFRGYERRDTAASVALGAGSLLFVTPINFAVFALATSLERFRIVDLGQGLLGWIVAILGWDFLFYWNHRAEHRVRLLWACHENHHSSKHFNLSTAVRQSWTPFASILFYPILALVGVAPWMIMVSGGTNLIFQFWVHTELVGKLPRAVEFIFNTPSHHRVHHGKNRRYIDKNYGGIVIVWDRLFGTFEKEVDTVSYGLTKDIDTFNLFRIAFHEYADMLREAGRATGVRAKIRAVFGPPGRSAE